MKDRQQNQFDAGQTTIDYLINDPATKAIWSTLPAFVDLEAKAEGSLNILHVLAQVQAGKTDGITGDKTRLKLSLFNRTVIAAKASITFGKAINNGDLVAHGNALNSAAELEDIRDGAIVDNVTALYSRALAARDANAVKAAGFGFVTGAGDKLLAPLLAALAAYGAVVQSPQDAVNRKANATTAIDTELHRLQDILQDLENLIPQFEEEHPEFVAGFHQARKIIDRGGGGKKPGDDTPTKPGATP